jgi:hypothetical protein
MTKSLKAVIETLLNQGYTKPQVLETLANEYWIDSASPVFLQPFNQPTRKVSP